MYESYGCCIWEGYICALGLPYRGSPQPIAEGLIIAPGFVIPPCQAAKLAPYPYSADISHGDCTCPIWTGWSKGLDALSHWFIGLVSGHPLTLSGETAPESNWFWISGCLPGPSAPWLGDASSTSASRFLLTGGPPVCLLCGLVSFTLPCACSGFTTSRESSLLLNSPYQEGLSPLKTLIKLFSIFFTFSSIHCQTSSSRDYWENESVSSWSPIYL